MHQMNFYEVKTGIVLKEQMVAEKANELTHMQDFLTPLLLQGRLISADALYTQRSFCRACPGFWRRLSPVCQAQSTHLTPGFVSLFWRTASRLS